MVQDEVDDRRALPVSQLGRVAADSGANDREDTGADDRADAQSCQRDWPKRLVQRVFRPLRFSDQFVDGFGCEDLPGQCACSSNKEGVGEVLLRTIAY